MLKEFTTFTTTFRYSSRMLFANPRLLAPIFLCWMIYAPTILWLKFGLETKHMLFLDQCMILFGVLLVFSLLLGLACSVTLE